MSDDIWQHDEVQVGLGISEAFIGIDLGVEGHQYELVSGDLAKYGLELTPTGKLTGFITADKFEFEDETKTLDFEVRADNGTIRQFEIEITNCPGIESNFFLMAK
jgi:hypothetical protein